MLTIIKKISPVPFAVMLICFFLPWLNLTCDGKHYTSFTGMELVTGTKVEQQSMYGTGKYKKVDPEPMAIVALALAIIGIVFSFIKKSGFNLAAGITGIATFIVLLILKSTVEKEIFDQVGRGVEVIWLFGFWFTLIISLIAAALNVLFYLRSKKEQ